MTSIALLGYGVVGSGLVELIDRNREKLRIRQDGELKISRILVRDKKKHLKKRYSELLTNDIEDIFNEKIDVVVEVMGGLHPAYEYVSRALKQKMHVVTANKDLIAEHGKELLELATENGVGLHFEASVGGGIPILKSLRECLVGNEIKEIIAIINGTTNFILSKMYSENMSYNDALELAQKLGFAEARPEADVLGYDAARKLSILSTIAYNKRADWKSMHIEGITDIEDIDFDYARKFHCNIKLIGLSRIEAGRIYATVQPMLVRSSSILGRVENEYNAIIVNGDAVGEVVFTGKGAGMLPTASAVFSDVIDTLQSKKQDQYFNSQIAEIMSLWDMAGEWMLRFKTVNNQSTIKRLHENFSTCATEICKGNSSESEIIALVRVKNEEDLIKKIKIIEEDKNTVLVKKLRKIDC